MVATGTSWGKEKTGFQFSNDHRGAAKDYRGIAISRLSLKGRPSLWG